MTTINLYCCGGMGVNTGVRFLKTAGEKQAGFATIHPYFIDTSDSNTLKVKGITEENHYRVIGDDKNTNGSGKVRTTNYTAIAESVPDILQKLRPGDYNIVIHSNSGGKPS